MKRIVLLCFWGFISTNCFAIENYKLGDTLWVWAKGGLNIREMPDVHSKVLGTIKNGSHLITLEHQNRSFPYKIEVIKKHVETINNEKILHPNFELHGYWVKIKHQDKTGYVFDAYLSKFPTILVEKNKILDEEDFHVVSLKKRYKIISQFGQNKYNKEDHKFVRYIFESGCIIEISGGSGYWVKDMLFPDNMSLIEGFLIYSHTMQAESDILLEKGEDYLIFEIDTGTLTIKKAGSFLIFHEEHAC